MRSKITFVIAIVVTLATGISHSQSEQTSVATSGEQVRTFSNGVAIDHSPGSGIVPLVSPPTADDESVKLINFSDPETGRTTSNEGETIGEKIENVSRRSSVAIQSNDASTEQSAATIASSTGHITIESMDFGATYSDRYYPYNGLLLFGPARTYYLSDGNNWRSGAGSYSTARALLDRVETSGTTIRYYFDPPIGGFVYKQTDYNSGDHSSNGSLGIVGPIVLETTVGSNSAAITGEVEILTNSPANYSEPRFNYWSAPVGAISPFSATYTLLDGVTFSETTFDTEQKIANEGTVNFAASRRPPL